MSKKAQDKSALEAEYRKIVADVRPQIEQKLREASDRIREAYALADKHDLPLSLKVGRPSEGFEVMRGIGEKSRWSPILSGWDDDREALRDLMNLGKFDLPDKGETGHWVRSEWCW